MKNKAQYYRDRYYAEFNVLKKGVAALKSLGKRFRKKASAVTPSKGGSSITPQQVGKQYTDANYGTPYQRSVNKKRSKDAHIKNIQGQQRRQQGSQQRVDAYTGQDQNYDKWRANRKKLGR